MTLTKKQIIKEDIALIKRRIINSKERQVEYANLADLEKKVIAELEEKLKIYQQG